MPQNHCRENNSPHLRSFILQVLSFHFNFFKKRWKDIPCVMSLRGKSLHNCFSSVAKVDMRVDLCKETQANPLHHRKQVL